MSLNKNPMYRNKRNADGLTEEEFLSVYEAGDYDQASTTVDIVNFRTNKGEDGISRLEVLLIKRKDHPWIGSWALPGGFVDVDNSDVSKSESVEDAARRELEEETGLEGIYLHPLKTFSTPGRDPRTNVITVPFFSLVEQSKSETIVAGDDAEDAAWFSVRKKYKGVDSNGRVQLALVLENKDLGYIEYVIHEEIVMNGRIPTIVTSVTQDVPSLNYLASDHAEIINYALTELRNKIDVEPIAFNLLPEEFTIGEVVSVYDAIWGSNLEDSHEDYNDYLKPLLQQNLRIKPVVRDNIKPVVGKKKQVGIGAPSQVYVLDIKI